jgi:hypothetical protein
MDVKTILLSLFWFSPALPCTLNVNTGSRSHETHAPNTRVLAG